MQFAICNFENFELRVVLPIKLLNETSVFLLISISRYSLGQEFLNGGPEVYIRLFKILRDLISKKNFQVNIEKLFANVEMSGKEKCCGLLRVFISLFQQIGALFMPGLRGNFCKL